MYFGYNSLNYLTLAQASTIAYTKIFFTMILALVFFKEISIYCILFSMVALGLQTNLKSMINLGFKPLIIGFIASATVGAVSVIYLY